MPAPRFSAGFSENHFCLFHGSKRPHWTWLRIRMWMSGAASSDPRESAHKIMGIRPHSWFTWQPGPRFPKGCKTPSFSTWAGNVEGLGFFQCSMQLWIRREIQKSSGVNVQLFDPCFWGIFIKVFFKKGKILGWHFYSKLLKTKRQWIAGKVIVLVNIYIFFW